MTTRKGHNDSSDPFQHLPEHEASILRKQVDTPASPKLNWRTLFRYASARDALIIAISSLCAIIAGVAVPLNTIIIGTIAGTFKNFAAGDLPKAEFDSQINHKTLYFVYLAIGEFVTIYIATVGFTYTGESITRKIREEYLKALLRQNAAYFDKLGPGQIITRITTDTNVIQEGISEKIELALIALSTFLAAYIVGFIKYWKLTLVMTSAIPVLYCAMFGLTKLIIKYSKLSSIAYSQGGVLVEEALSSIKTVTGFGAQEHLAKEYDTHLARAEGYGLRLKSIAGSGPGFTICIFNLGYALASWLGSQYIVKGETSLSAVLTILLVMMLGAFSLSKAAQHTQAFANAVAAATEIYATIDRVPPWNDSPSVGTILENLEGRIELRNIKHIYPSRPDVVVLEDLNLTIPAGSTIAITGASGSGKSTIVALLERFYSPVSGDVLIDGHNIADLNLHWVRQQIGLVSQDPTLFSASVEENILYGLRGTAAQQNANDRRKLVEEAARLANAHDFIMQLPEGYDTHVGERGSFLSGGQKQRIAIARAVISNPKIMLFDEATSALDSKTEGVVQAALDKAAQGRTTIVVSHRMSTIKNADNIVVLGQGGKILEQGTYEELSAIKGAFHQLVEAQNMARKTYQHDDIDLVHNEKAALADEIRNEKVPAEALAIRASSTSSERDTTINKATDAAAFNQQQNDQKASPHSLWTLIKFAASLNRQEWKIMLFGIIVSILSGAGEPVQCIILAQTVATLSLPSSQYQKLRDDANFWSGMFLMIGLVMLLFSLVFGVSFAYGSEKLDIRFFDRTENSVGGLAAFLSTETTHLAGMSGLALGTIVQLVATLVIGYIVALAVGWKLALVCISTVPILLVAGFLSFWSLARFETYLKDSYRESSSFACEATSSTRTIVSLTLENEIWQRYHDLLVDQASRTLRFNLKSSILYAASQSLGFLCMALAFWYGSSLLGEYSLSQFYLVFFCVIFGTRSAANMFALAPNMAKAKVAAGELKSLYDRTPEIDVWSTEGDILEDIQGSIEFRDVEFAYQPGQPILKNINFKVLPGQYIALVGSSGCGKSTIISLLERFYNPSNGNILIDDKTISTLNLAEYRKHLALVLQEPALYQGTIRENILLAVNEDDISAEKLIKVCKEANIYDFITSLPSGFDTIVGSKGTMLSGGQKQRIAIARALMRDPKILLLDEATSALDSESESVVQAALDAAAKGRTTIAVAHRLSTVRNADAIYVVDGGQIVESGTHAALMSQRGRYFELVQLQSSEKDEKMVS
ncbi:hypothetical protein CKM354_000548700 [Cercospora kikuchii]|uniref:ABC transporter n=1 Tax=Cercospora kikuchii TaxID=84275 RepID=A0A9P3FGV4_9PEZI|nr:uncharacterized protein CKM354_000548700 [Cercospora kikuchii]GIZ42209.1 hypothetical protein CKM354_000548700 [Cercospora kikuchii]